MQDTIKYPNSAKFYKKTAELQVKMTKPEADSDGRITKKGCIFFEMAKALSEGEGRMDWSNKVIMKIGNNDIAQILYGLQTKAKEIKLFHKNDSGSSTCIIEPGNEGSYRVSLFKSIGETKLNASLYLSGPDMLILASLLRFSIPETLGWS